MPPTDKPIRNTVTKARPSIAVLRHRSEGGCDLLPTVAFPKVPGRVGSSSGTLLTIPGDWVILSAGRDLLRLVGKFHVSCAQNFPLSPKLRTSLARRSAQHVVGQLPIFVLPSHAGLLFLVL